MTPEQQAKVTYPNLVVAGAIQQGLEKSPFGPLEERYFQLTGYDYLKPVAGPPIATVVLPKPTSSEVLRVGQQVHPTDYRDSLGWFGKTKRRIVRADAQLYLWMNRQCLEEDHCQMVQQTIDDCDRDIAHGNVTNMLIEFVNGTYTVRYDHVSEEPGTNTNQAARASTTMQLTKGGEYTVHHLSYRLMKHTKLVLGCLEKTQINKTRVRDYSVQELRRLRSLDDPSLKLVRTEDLESIVEDAVMMYFIPTRQDLVRHQVETRDRVYAGMVRRNDDIAQFRSSMA
jgi:hypothetical protein